MDTADPHRSSPALGFRPLRRADLALLHEWLQRPHVRRWWTSRETYAEVVEHYLPCIEGTRPTRLFLGLLDDRPIGFLQTYLLADYPDDARVVGAPDGAAGVDLFLADERRLGQGLGSELLLRFVSGIVFDRPATSCCVADPETGNAASVRAFRKAGFRVVEEFLDPRDGKEHMLLRRDRDGRTDAHLRAVARVYGPEAWDVSDRRRDGIVEAAGRDVYEHIESNLHWLVYQFLGKLLPTVYALRKTT